MSASSKSPSTPVSVPFWVPTTATVAAMIGCPLMSVTRPRTEFGAAAGLDAAEGCFLVTEMRCPSMVQVTSCPANTWSRTSRMVAFLAETEMRLVRSTSSELTMME